MFIVIYEVREFMVYYELGCEMYVFICFLGEHLKRKFGR